MILFFLFFREMDTLWNDVGNKTVMKMGKNYSEGLCRPELKFSDFMSHPPPPPPPLPPPRPPPRPRLRLQRPLLPLLPLLRLLAHGA